MNLVDIENQQLGNIIREKVKAILTEEHITPTDIPEFDTWDNLTDDWDLNVWADDDGIISIAVYPVVDGETRGDLWFVLDPFTYLPVNFALTLALDK